MKSSFKKKFSVPRTKKKGPNATESKYLRDILSCYNDGHHAITFEPTHFGVTKMTHREYTPDFLVRDTTGVERPSYHEVKGSYHLPTHERARLAWEIAAELNPQFDFVWAELTRRGWEIEWWIDGGRKILVHYATMPSGKWIEANADWRRHKPRKRAKKV